jgi:protein phosphatase
MEAWSLSDTGKVRSQNQDCCHVERLDDGQLLAIVCDGMGGARAGDVASRMAVEIFTDEVRRFVKPHMTPAQAEKLLRSALELANRTVYEQSQLSDDFKGMGTTLVAVLVLEHSGMFINVGDSRAYHLSASGVTQVTRDHSLVELMVQQGRLTPEQAKKYPGKNLITRAVGTEANVNGDCYQTELQAGDYLLLCSDGLSNLFSDQELLFEVIHGADKDSCCERLVKLALNRGAPDNVTVALIQI